MKRIVATFNLVTPMFMSGADQNIFELRSESFKGMLRFWWRALAFGRHVGNLTNIHAEECTLFGSSDSGQGSFRLRVHESGAHSGVVQLKDAQFNCTGKSALTYLGYGVMDFRGKLSRSCLLPPAQITLELLFKAEPASTIINALKLFGLLGGAGSRSRRGYGSLSLKNIDIDGSIVWRAPANIEEYKVEVEKLIGSPKSRLPDYTAFSDETRITCVNLNDYDAISLLNDIGEQMQMYRSWKKEKNFIDDHDSLRNSLTRRTTITKHPDRTVFGLPHNYFFSSIKAKSGVIPETQTRRASPLMIHIHKFTGTSFVGIISIFPAQFLPANEKINVGGTLVDELVDFIHLHNFVNGFKGPRWAKTTDLYFPDKQQIFP